MKEFMFVFRGGNATDENRSPEQMQQDMMKWKAWIDRIAANGKYIAGQPLVPQGKVIAGKQKKVTDGPFAEGKEVVGGYFLIKASDIDEALEISKDCPGFEYDGSVEVREVLQMNM